MTMNDAKYSLNLRWWNETHHHESGCNAGFPACGFTGLSSPVFRDLGTGDWKVARTRRLESLRYSTTVAPVHGFHAQNLVRGIITPASWRITATGMRKV